MATRRKRTTSSRSRARPLANKAAIKNAAAAVAGGATGAVVGGLLVRSGIKPTTAAVGIALAGGVAAATMKGMTRLAAGGAAAAGAGQLALSWLATQEKRTTLAAAPAPGVRMLPGRTRNLERADVDAAFERAREEIDMLDEATRYADDYSD